MEKQLFDYDDNNIESVVDYSKILLNKKFEQIIEEYQKTPYKTYEDFQTKTVSNVPDKRLV